MTILYSIPNFERMNQTGIGKIISLRFDPDLDLTQDKVELKPLTSPSYYPGVN